MRVFELAKDHGVDAKKLVEALQGAGFDVRNSLASVESDVVAWVDAQAGDGFPALGGAAPAPAPAKKKVPAAAAEKKPEPTPAPTATAEADADEEEEEAESSSEPASTPQSSVRKKVKRKKKVPAGGTAPELQEPVPAPEPEPVASTPEQAAAPEPAEVQAEPEAEAEERFDPEAAAVDEPLAETASAHPVIEEPRAGKVQDDEDEEEEREPRAEHKADHKAEHKPKRQQPRREQKPKARGKDLKLAPTTEAADLDGEDAEGAKLIIDEGETEHQTGQKHKRADFRMRQKVAELPASFAELDSNVSLGRSLGGGRRRRGGRRSAGAGGRRSRRGPARNVTKERDPDAVAQVHLGMTVRDLSTALGIKINDIVGFFMKNGTLVNVNEVLTEEDITLIAEEFGVNYEWKAQQDLEKELEAHLDQQELDVDPDKLVMRPPVVTFLGHVDHGKTSLLDRIRSSRVAAHEAGGITQHMGAYNVRVRNSEITFLDTPGHEAFTAMRARGANLTDIAVLVVAADDGVMPQTEEACSHARNAGVPIVVAINKCDMPNANPDKVRQELSNRLNLLPEEWGGSTGMVEVSAITGQGIDTLLERILLESEMLELQSDPTRNATGYVIEAKISESRGVIVTMLVTDGTLRRGDVVLCSSAHGRVKLMFDEHGHTIDSAGPGTPVRIVGLNTVPEAGDRIYVLDDMQKARAIAEQREHETRNATLSKRSHVTLETLQRHLGQEGVKDLRIIIKADVKGSLEVLEKTLNDLSTDEVKITVIHSGVGGINQADVILADASDALIVGFHVVADQSARLQASSLGVQVKIYHIIYRLIEDMRAALEGMLPPEEREVVQGHVEVRQVFKASRLGNIAGCHVTDGLITRTSRVRVIRNNIVVYDGALDSLKRFKDDAREVREGYECGIKVANYDDIKEGDMLEAYTVEEVARKLQG